MALIVDFLLLAATGGACFYCWILNRRLKALTSNEDGFQSGISALAHSAEEMQNTMRSAQASAKEDAERLQGLLNACDEKASQLNGILESIAELETEYSDPDGSEIDQDDVELISVEKDEGDKNEGVAA